MKLRSLSGFGVVALLALSASFTHAQLIITPGNGNFEDITNLQGTFDLNVPFNGFVDQPTALGNPVFPAGTIRVGYNATLGNNVGTSVSGPHQPLPSGELYDGKTALSVIWDTPDPAFATTDVLFREFTEDPNDQYYIVQWNDLPMGAQGGKATFQARVNHQNSFRAPVFAQFSYLNVEEIGIEGGAFSTIGYQAQDNGFNTVQWSFDQPGAVSNGSDLFIMLVPAPSAGTLLLIGALGVSRRRR